jgi:hypothetical protein
MKNYLLLSCLLFVLSCKNESNNSPAKDSTIVISYDTIPAARSFVSQKPVASYSESVNDELNNWKFAVSVYETSRTFHFILRIQYKELRISDSLSIPNFGIEPRVELRKGPEPLSCIIGFLDKKGEFKPYRKAAIKNEQLKLTRLASYYVGVYRTPQKN